MDLYLVFNEFWKKSNTRKSNATVSRRSRVLIAGFYNFNLSNLNRKKRNQNVDVNIANIGCVIFDLFVFGVEFPVLE